MSDEIVCELNIALAPEESLASRHIDLSGRMAHRYPPRITLTPGTRRLAFAPHLTLYQVPVPAADLPAVSDRLSGLAAATGPFALAATELRANADEGSFEVRYEPATRLMAFQAQLIDLVNPFRGTRLLERDPAGRRLTELVTEAGVKGDNFRRTGFDAVGDPAEGGLFQPHVTINWFDVGTSVSLDDPELPPVADLAGQFDVLGIYLLGPYGTCAQRLAAWPLAGAAH